jgi:hypothetical protein
MILLIYTLQVVLGTILWKKLKFSFKDSFIFSIFVLPTIILVSIFTVDFFFKFFARYKARVFKNKTVIKCTGNNDNGCFMDSCSINCNCEGLKELDEKLKK